MYTILKVRIINVFLSSQAKKVVETAPQSSWVQSKLWNKGCRKPDRPESQCSSLPSLPNLDPRSLLEWMPELEPKARHKTSSLVTVAYFLVGAELGMRAELRWAPGASWSMFSALTSDLTLAPDMCNSPRKPGSRLGWGHLWQGTSVTFFLH